MSKGFLTKSVDYLFFILRLVSHRTQVNDTQLTCWGAGNESATCYYKTSLLPDRSPSDGDTLRFLFDLGYKGWTDQAIGGILLVIALIAMSWSLVMIVKVLRSSLEGKKLMSNSQSHFYRIQKCLCVCVCGKG